MDVNEKIKLFEIFALETSTIRPGRRLFMVRPESVREIFKSLVERYGYEGFYLSTIVGTDLENEGKIRLDYYIVLLPEGETIAIRTHVPRNAPEIDSIVDIVPGALAGECETHDLLGVVFRGNPSLKRGFFAPSDIAGNSIYPLRKDSGV